MGELDGELDGDALDGELDRGFDAKELDGGIRGLDAEPAELDEGSQADADISAMKNA
ncbi:hypothetical protein JZ785_15730 [Alicyclobacillus curvatus]|nr:hypothetical protein JZ785_15730 [Alicyclobacillus curvatus]